MNEIYVGASILNIITESLYERPIVVFREYVQNSVDSISMIETEDNKKRLCNHVWCKEDNLYFLDNGKGIKKEEFLAKMKSIALSSKEKTINLGYKGIGRLSGISYCKKLRFINIIDFNNNVFQEYSIDCIEYAKLQKTEDYNELSFEELMNRIGTLNDNVLSSEIHEIIKKHENIFQKRNTGFLVILEDISQVLKNVIKGKKFETDLGWLLPVPFESELYSGTENNDILFKTLSEEKMLNDIIAAKSYNIFYNGNQIFRPIKRNMLRKYTCKSIMGNYAICIQSFSNEKIQIDSTNAFSGIRVYIDNMLLCDESELVTMLEQHSYTNTSKNELIQAARGIGAMIYIVDKVNISANARRTFIETTDQDSMNLLQMMGTFVDNVNAARYALSKYASALKNSESIESDIEIKKEKALTQLQKLASDEIQIEVKQEEKQTEFEKLNITEQKKIVKTKISRVINESIKEYLNNATSFNIETCTEDFKTWFLSN